MTYSGTKRKPSPKRDQPYRAKPSPIATATAMTTTSMSPEVPALRQDESLREIPILDYLDRDTRPTFILRHEQARVEYCNAALQSHLKAQQIEYRIFSEWALSTPFNAVSLNPLFGALSWSSVQLQQKWVVVSACWQDPAPRLPANISPAPRGPPSAAPFPMRSRAQSVKAVVPPRLGQSMRSGSGTETEISRDTRPAYNAVNSSGASSSWQTASEDGGYRPPVQLDWTRHYVPGLSSHIRLVQQFDWASTPVGAIETWPNALRQIVIAMMNNTDPRVLMWGEERRMIYNEACAALFGIKHPAAMGAMAQEIWSVSWEGLEPIVRRAEAEGKSTKISRMPLPMNRHGYPEETHWTLQMIPIVGPEGDVLGVVDEFAEITHSIIAERRRDAVVRINQLMSNVTNMKELCFEFLEGLETCNDDVPFALLYVASSEHSAETGRANLENDVPHTYTLEGSVGISSPHSATIPRSIDLNTVPPSQKSMAWACRKSWKSREDVVLRAKDDTLPDELALTVEGRAQGEKVKTVCVLPVSDYSGTGNIVAFLIIAVTPQRPYDGDAAGFVHYLRDILTKSASAIVLPEEQRKARQKFEEIETSLAQQLRASALEAEKVEARYAQMTQIAPIGMYAIAPTSETLYFNDAYLAVTGITREEAEDPRAEPKDAIHPDDRDRVVAAWMNCIEDKQPFTIEYRVIKPWIHLDPSTGEEIVGESWVLANAMPELDEMGNILHIQGWLLDISDRKDHERLRIKRAHNEKAEARFARLAQTAPLGMFLLQVDGKPIYLNDAYFDQLGFTRSDFEEAESRGLGWADRIADEDKDAVAVAWERLTVHGEALNLAYRIKKPWRAYDTATGTEMSGPTWLQATAVAEMDEDGNPVAVQGFVTEVSMKKFSERLLAERLEDALETKQQADRFIDMVSHEMRNPLSAILQSADGVLTALETSGLPILDEDMTITSETVETILDSAQTIVLCAQHQKRIVDDILCLSKLDSNLLVICPDRVSPPALIDKTFKMYEGELARSSVAASMLVDTSFKELNVEDVMLDSSRILQVVINLFTNAIKFTQYSERREIRVHLSASKDRPTLLRDGTTFIAPRANRPDHTTTPEWGSGEEIYIQIDVEDSGRGLNEEELKLLFQRFQQASPKTYKQYGGSGLGLFISRELSELQGGQIGVCSEEGKGSTFSFFVKARRSVPDVPTPGIEDIRMRTPTLLSSPVTYARAGSVTSLDGALSESGRSLGSIANVKTTSTLKRTSPLSMSLTEPLYILVVEDNLVNQRVMAQQLKRLGCVVHVANHGLEALEFLRRTTFWNQDLPVQAASLEPLPSMSTPIETSSMVPLSLVLMDLEMPVLGGLDTIIEIRGLQRAGHIKSHVPVIAVTANARSEQIAIAIDHGMDSVVTKPFRIPELVPQMQTLVSRVRAELVE